MLDFSYGFAEFLEALSETIESIMSKSSEEFTEWCEENEIPPCGLMAVINQLTREMRKDKPYFDPRIELFDKAVPYLAKNDLIYDERLGAFREA